MNCVEFAKAVNGFSLIASFSYVTDMSTGYSDFTLRLMDGDLEGARDVILKFTQVRELRMKPLGAGIQQFMMLRIEDIRDRQLDLVNYRLVELENDDISCLFLNVEVVEETLVKVA